MPSLKRGKKPGVVGQGRSVKRPSDLFIKEIHKQETKNKGCIACVEPETGDYFLGRTGVEAIRKAKEKYPDKTFYLLRVGYPYVDTYKRKGP